MGEHISNGRQWLLNAIKWFYFNLTKRNRRSQDTIDTLSKFGCIHKANSGGCVLWVFGNYVIRSVFSPNWFTRLRFLSSQLFLFMFHNESHRRVSLCADLLFIFSMSFYIYMLLFFISLESPFPHYTFFAVEKEASAFFQPFNFRLKFLAKRKAKTSTVAHIF